MVITAQKPFSSGIGGAWFAKLGTKVCLPAAARGVKKEKTLSDKCQIPPPLFRLKIPTEDNQEADRGAGGTLDCGLGLTDSFFCFVPDLRSLSLSDAAQKCVCVCERDLYVVHAAPGLLHHGHPRAQHTPHRSLFFLSLDEEGANYELQHG